MFTILPSKACFAGFVHASTHLCLQCCQSFLPNLAFARFCRKNHEKPEFGNPTTAKFSTEMRTFLYIFGYSQEWCIFPFRWNILSTGAHFGEFFGVVSLWRPNDLSFCRLFGAFRKRPASFCAPIDLFLHTSGRHMQFFEGLWTVSATKRVKSCLFTYLRACFIF